MKYQKLTGQTWNCRSCREPYIAELHGVYTGYRSFVVLHHVSCDLPVFDRRSRIVRTRKVAA